MLKDKYNPADSYLVKLWLNLDRKICYYDLNEQSVW